MHLAGERLWLGAVGRIPASITRSLRERGDYSEKSNRSENGGFEVSHGIDQLSEPIYIGSIRTPRSASSKSVLAAVHNLAMRRIARRTNLQQIDCPSLRADLCGRFAELRPDIQHQLTGAEGVAGIGMMSHPLNVAMCSFEFSRSLICGCSIIERQCFNFCVVSLKIPSRSLRGPGPSAARQFSGLGVSRQVDAGSASFPLARHPTTSGRNFPCRIASPTIDVCEPTALRLVPRRTLVRPALAWELVEIGGFSRR